MKQKAGVRQIGSSIRVKVERSVVTSADKNSYSNSADVELELEQQPLYAMASVKCRQQTRLLLVLPVIQDPSFNETLYVKRL